MNTATENFEKFLLQCRAFNPSSLTASASNANEKIASATDAGLLLVRDNLIGKKVLILGCGDGFEVDYACDRLGWDAIGVTFHEEEFERSCCSPERIVKCDMHALEFDNHAFDFCYSKETLEHVACPPLALIEMNRVLKPGAKFFHLIADGWQKQRDWYHLACYPDFIWCDLFRKAYMRVDKVIGFPDCDRCAFENKAYTGRKFADRPLDETVEQFKEMLNFGAYV
jgi:SAM-dependent methyltransferase